VRASAASLASARAALAKTLITAPFSGIVAKIDVKRGEFVPSNTSKVTLISDGAFQIETYVPQISVAAVLPQDTAAVTLDAYGPALPFTARVLSVDPAETIRDGVATYKTMLAFETTDPRVRSGMTANVSITTAILPSAIVIPFGAVLHDTDGTYVELANGVRQAVTLGEPVSLGRVEIKEGLEDGDVILLTP
jgi:RND family efflux transporter MFP subunit